MSAFTVINDVTVELRRRIYQAMTTAQGVTLGFTSESSNIILSPPQETNEANAKLSLYLYHVGINNALRNQNLLPQAGKSDELRLPPLPIELRYICTPIDDEETNQLMIGRLLQFVYDESSVSTINNVPLGDSFGGASSELRITPDLMNVEQLSQLWNAFSQPFRLSMSFQVDVIAIDSVKAPIVAPRVTEMFTGNGIKERDA